jgi:hypothetical protein
VAKVIRLNAESSYFSQYLVRLVLIVKPFCFARCFSLDSSGYEIRKGSTPSVFEVPEA